MYLLIGVAAFVIFLLWLIFVDADLVTLFYLTLHKVAVSQNSRTEFFKGKVAWITGASSGIGEAIAYDLAKYGCRLILSARRVSRLEEVRNKCIQIGKSNVPGYKDGDVTILPLDVMEMDQHESMAQKACSMHSRIDILVNSAGRTQRCFFEDAEFAVIDGILKLDLVCHISLTKYVLPVMISQNSGIIVNLNSVAGKFGCSNSSLYCAAKFGLRGFMDALRMEVGKYNINVLNVCAGQVETELFGAAFTKDADVSYGEVVDLKTTGKTAMLRLTPQRCAHMISISIAANLKEIWISKNPVLLLVYISQYFPTFALFVSTYASSSSISKHLREPGTQKKQQ